MDFLRFSRICKINIKNRAQKCYCKHALMLGVFVGQSNVYPPSLRVFPPERLPPVTFNTWYIAHDLPACYCKHAVLST